MLFELLGLVKATYDLNKAEREMYREMCEEEKRQEELRKERERKRIEQENRAKRADKIAKIIAFVIVFAVLGWLGLNEIYFIEKIRGSFFIRNFQFLTG